MTDNGTKRIRWIVSILHFLLTFLWERGLFHFQNNWDGWTLTVRGDAISGKAEILITYGLSKLCALVLICLIWKVIFDIAEKKVQTSTVCLFGILFLVGLIAGLISYPDNFGLEVDNYGNLFKALRFQPNYWQSIYTGVVYSGSMMVIPHPFGIFCIQWMGYVLTLAYIFEGIGRIYQGTKWKYAVLLLLILPESYFVMQNAYRNDYYTILCLFYFAYLFFALVEKRAHSVKEMLVIALFSGFMMVWRSEGIFVGLGGMFLLLVLVYRAKAVQIALVVFCFLASFVSLNKIQGIGATKYFGQDYMIVNTTNVLYSVLNDPQVDLEYEGAQEDLAAIEAVVPVAALKEKGLTGYRSYNYANGHGGFNQSLADDDAAAGYMSAYYHIIGHNPMDYLMVQLNYFFNSMKLPFKVKTHTFKGEETLTYEKFKYNAWKKGKEELEDTPLTRAWMEQPLRKAIYEPVDEALALYRGGWNRTINGYLHLIAVIVDLILLITGCVLTIVKRNGKEFGKWILSGILAAELLAIFLFMPEGRPVYLYPMLFVSYFITFIYILDWKKEKGGR